jgi:prepilin-type N-terminal cleavage/methylation domain-containing protein
VDAGQTAGVHLTAVLLDNGDVVVGIGRRRRNVRWQLMLRSQRGMTLIEMLIVISILGILAGVVSLSVVGITNNARQRALDGEQAQIQSAMNFMIADQLIDPGDACLDYTAPTDDMRTFPSSRPFQNSGGQGQQTDHKPVALYPHYLHAWHTQRQYKCTLGGGVQPA